MAKKPDKTKKAKTKSASAKKTKKAVKKARKTPTRRQPPAGTPPERKPKTVSDSRVSVFGMAELVKMFHEAGKESELNRILGPQPRDRAVKIDAGKLTEIKNFVRSQREWDAHPLTIDMNADNCQDDDPYCVHWGHRRTFVRE
ncbi:hypothetical protein AB7645_41175 [Bradyrhizobium sp. 956_D2_N1_5]|uniref:hypothetical protein n=1 Tax=unclassified Bradyrhizobium TaxID=2631580 RepID=UPI003F296557